MTENCCVCSYLDTINKEGKGSVGIPWDAVDIKIGDEGEIWTKSPYLLKEYYKNKELTAEVMKDGCCLLYTSPSPRDKRQSRMPSSA